MSADIRDEWVEKAAVAAYNSAATVMKFPTGFDGAPTGIQKTYSAIARACIAAVADDIRAQALRDAADELEGLVQIPGVPRWLRERAEEVSK